MSDIIGQSGAWQVITNKIKQTGLIIEQPEELPDLIKNAEVNFPEMVEQHLEKTKFSINEINNEISILKMERNIFKKITNFFYILAKKKKIKQEENIYRNYRAKKIKDLEYLKKLPNSGEFVGAKAEIEVIENLKKLPSNYYVFNDINLFAARRINFDGSLLESSQIDHIVLCPAGIFIIETKCWSKFFVQSGNYFNPFDQIKRSSYLCYDLLHTKYNNLKIHSIIVSFGFLPDTPLNTYTKVVKPYELNKHIMKYNYNSLNNEQITELNSFFFSTYQKLI